MAIRIAAETVLVEASKTTADVTTSLQEVARNRRSLRIAEPISFCGSAQLSPCAGLLLSAGVIASVSRGSATAVGNDVAPATTASPRVPNPNATMVEAANASRNVFSFG